MTDDKARIYEAAAALVEAACPSMADGEVRLVVQDRRIGLVLVAAPAAVVLSARRDMVCERPIVVD